MALLRSKLTEVPPDAVVLTEDEALKYQYKILRNWKDQNDVWAFKYGSAILASFSALSGIYINNHYRKMLMLFNYGRMSSYLPICVLPATLSLLIHNEYVLPDIVLQQSCAVCTEVRASAFQAAAGCILPNLLAPLSAFPLAIRYATYDIPYITKNPGNVLKLWKKIVSPIGNILFAIFIGQALLASVVTNLEMKSIDKCNRRLMELEYELEQASNI